MAHEMTSSNTIKNTTQCKTCQCGDGEKNIWTAKSSESSEKQTQNCPNCQVIKCGFLFLSSKGIGWTSWKKRWFVLSHTSLVFYRSDPNALPQKGGEVNPSLGGVDLNSSASVVLKADRKLLTVFFPDAQEGRTFTLKGETSEELQEWKTALEGALAQAPSAALEIAQNGIITNEITDTPEASFEQLQNKKPAISKVIGRPVLLALEDVDGSPSFLEKALRYIEDYGIKVEGILRQSADVEEVERRVQEYEEGKNEFSSDEDAHVIGDCIKYVLRELPSSPVPASCCTALVEAYRIDRGNRINAIRDAIAETFPEPNLHLLQRVLKMMAIVAAHKSENRMSLPALAACMAPLLLRPLLAGDCEFEDNFNMGGDGSLQLLKAAAAANHAQAIVIIMLEEYERIFDDDFSQDGSLSSEIYTESEGHDTEDDGSSYVEIDDDDDDDDDGSHYSHSSLGTNIEGDHEHSSRGTGSGSASYIGSDLSDNERDGRSSYSSSRGDTEDVEDTETPSSSVNATASGQDIGQKTSTRDIQLTQGAGAQRNGVLQNENTNSAASASSQANSSKGGVHTSSSLQKSTSSKSGKSRNKSTASMRRPTKWGRTSARKNLPMESADHSTDDEIAIQRLEATKSDLETKITKEVKGNGVLRESLEKRKEALHERRLALEKDVEILREQLQKERELRLSLESGLMNMRPGHASITPDMDSKTRADLEEIIFAEADIVNLKQKVTDLRGQLSHLQQPGCIPLCISCKQQIDKKEKNLDKIVDNALLHANENASASDIEDVITKPQTSSPPPPNDQPGKQELSNKNHDSIPSNEVPESIAIDAAPHNSASGSEKSKSSLPLTGTQLSQKLSDETMPVVWDSASNKISKGENPKVRSEMDASRGKAQNQNSPTHKVPRQPQTTNQRRTKSNEAPSTEEPTTLTRNYASKRSTFRAENQEKATFSSQDAPLSVSSVTTLSRLTNRLNFLKERRLQLANELQNLDANRPSGPESVPRTNSR